MLEGSRKTADDFKSEILPKPDGALVGADDKIELHGTESASFSVVERMHTHRTRHASAGGAKGGHVAAIGYVRASSLLIGVQEIGPDHFLVFFGNEYFIAGGEPVGESLLPRHLAGQCVSCPGTDGGLDDFPDRIGVAAAGGTYGYHGTNIAPR